MNHPRGEKKLEKHGKLPTGEFEARGGAEVPSLAHEETNSAVVLCVISCAECAVCAVRGALLGISKIQGVSKIHVGDIYQGAGDTTRYMIYLCCLPLVCFTANLPAIGINSCHP